MTPEPPQTGSGKTNPTGGPIRPLEKYPVDLYRDLIELSPDAVFVKSGGRFVFANPAALDLFGAKSHQEIEGMPVLERIHPKDREGFMHRIEDLYGDQKENPLQQETFLRLDGTPVEVEAVARRINFNGHNGALIFVRDLTERLTTQREMHDNREALRLSEERFRLALANTPITVYAMDCHLRYTWVYNPKRGFDADTVLGKTDIELIGASQGGRLTAVKSKVITTGENVEAEVILDEDPVAGVFQLHLEPLLAADGSVVGLIGASNEITHLRQLEAREAENRAHIEVQQRLIQQRELERVEIARDLHDGPLQDLAGIKISLLELYQEAPEPLRQQMNAVIDQINAQIADLRFFCSELRPPALAPFGLEKAIRSHIETFRQRHPAISIELNLMPDGTLLPEENRMALFRVYQELINNIVKHAQASRVLITLVVSEDELVLEVEDNGVGFALPGNWLDLMRAGHLGLVGMRERVEAVGGRISILSSPGMGSSVQITVPRTATT